MNPIALIGFFGSRELVTQTYTTSQTVAVPASVSNLVSVTGEGANGSAASFSSTEITLMYSPDSATQPGGTTISCAAAIAAGTAEGAKFNGSTATRTVEHDRLTYRCGPDNLTKLSSSTRYTRVRGAPSFAASGSTGNITNSPPNHVAYVMTIDVESSATTGASSTGFGKTFPGGVGGAATPFTYNNVAVTPSGSYALVIPSGGFITISYYA